MLEVSGNYFLQIKFGDTEIPINTQCLLECSIIQDLNKLLPSFRMRFADATGILTHIAPFDKSMNSIYVVVGKSTGDSELNNFLFKIYSRNPEKIGHSGTIYDIDGLLDVSNLFVPKHSRASSGTIKSWLGQIAQTEFNADRINISNSLELEKVIIQPKWTNATLFRDLKNRLFGADNDSCYKIFFTMHNGALNFNCMSINDLSQQQSEYKFVIGDAPIQDYYPAVSYKIYDNYMTLGLLAGRTQSYSYFDYDNSVFMNTNENTNAYLSLSDYFLIDSNDAVDSSEMHFGRSNEFDQQFVGRARSSYYGRLNDLTKLEIDTWGLPNIMPGNIVQVIFGQGIIGGQMSSYQYSGFWMVERTILTLGATMFTRLILTRNGIDTDRKTSLLPASKKKINAFVNNMTRL